MVKNDLIRYGIDSLLDELYSAAIYENLSRMYRGRSVSEKLKRIAEMERQHAEFWRSFLEKRGVDTSRFKVNRVKLFLYIILYRLLGLGLTLKILELGERNAVEIYSKILEDLSLDHDGRERLIKILEDELVHEDEFADEESRFKDFLDHVRDAILGMSDGLVEILSVSAGLAGAYGSPLPVALGGLIVGIAGSLSMGLGTFASVRAQRQVRMSVLSRIRVAARYVSHLFTRRVVDYMLKKGFREETAKSIAEDASRNKELLSRVVAEEEYGLREEALENPVKAGLYTGVFYIVGALVPLTPYFLLLSITLAIPLSFLIAALMLAITGFIIAVSASLSIKAKMMELVVAGLGSATLTFIVGRIASILLGIEVG